jgi:hypothetical protein
MSTTGIRDDEVHYAACSPFGIAMASGTTVQLRSVSLI